MKGGSNTTDRNYMKAAIKLAEKGIGGVNPNPLVGAVIVKDQRIIGAGYHERYGGPHAERNALASCGESPGGAVLYVTLEPCCHYGKTLPCTEAIIESGIRRVVIGSEDPNPLVSGKSAAILREHGIEVETAVLKGECDQLNQVFFHYITRHTPYVIMKYAMTMDGKIAAVSGESRWITGEAARRQVHQDRRRYASVLVGMGTVLTDDPMLTCRLPNGRNPLRVICDTRLRTPLQSKLVRSAHEVPTILATCCEDKERKKQYESFGCEVMVMPKIMPKVMPGAQRIDLALLMQNLGARGIDSMILEGGQELNWSALESHIVNKIQVYIAPKIVGGEGGKTPVGGRGVEQLSQAFGFSKPRIRRFGDDIMLESEVLSCLQES